MARKPSTKSQDTVVLPKTTAGIATVTPSTGKSPDSQLPENTISYYNKTVQDLRRETDLFKAIRTLARISGDVGTAIAAAVRLASTPLNYRVYDMTHQLSDDGQTLLRSLLVRFDYLADYAKGGFDDRQSLSGLTDSLLREVLLSGACAGELVLDDARLPYRPLAVSPSQLKWKTSKQKLGKDTYKVIPYQQSQGTTVDLDIPTFFYAAIDADPTLLHPRSMLEAALNTSIFQAETIEDIRRVVRRSGHSRLTVKLITEQLVKAAPLDVRADPKKLNEWMEQVRVDLKTELEKVNPESALILFDTMEADYLNSEIGASADYTPLVDMVDGIQATALRTPPSVLGKRMGGSQNVSSTESLLFIKQVSGLQKPVATVLSRMLTLAMRLYGFDGYVSVEFGKIDLRPEQELEAFKAMEQARILELLSLGFLSDQEAAEMLNTGPRAQGAPPLSGTFFYKPDASAAPSPNGDPARRALTTDAPKSAGGRDNSKSRS